MNKHKCPNCGIPSVTVFQKLGLGPLKKLKCAGCGVLITVPWLIGALVMTIGTFIPWIGGVLAIRIIPNLSSPIMFFSSFLFGFILFSLLVLWFYNKYVPLIFKT